MRRHFFRVYLVFSIASGLTSTNTSSFLFVIPTLPDSLSNMSALLFTGGLCRLRVEELVRESCNFIL